MLFSQKYIFLVFFFKLTIFHFLSIDLAVLSNSLLKRIFFTPTAFIFLQQYEAISKDYETEYKNSIKYIDNDNLDDDVDYFIEYIKPFSIKKTKVNKFYIL